MSEPDKKDPPSNKALQRVDTIDDLGDVQYELHFEETLHLSNTVKDKLTFMVFAMVIYISCFIAGWAPNYFYIWYTLLSVILIPYRWYLLLNLQHYFYVLMFCYYGNFAVLFYLWFPSQIFGSSLRNVLFPMCFSIALGPVLGSAVVQGNSLVLHSTGKMTGMYLHLFPVFAMWGIRWYGTEDQGLGLDSHLKDSNGNYTFGAYELIVLPGLFYTVWQIMFLFLTEGLLKKYGTLYTFYKRQGKRFIVYRYSGLFGPKYQKVTFYVFAYLLPMSSLLLGYYSMYSKAFGAVLGVLALMAVSYSGATFYIDHFSKNYYSERVLLKRLSESRFKKE